MKMQMTVGGGSRVGASEFGWACAFGRECTGKQMFSAYGGYFGGAVVIADRWALTAGHCLQRLGGFDGNGRLVLKDTPVTLRITLDKTLPRKAGVAVNSRQIDFVQRHPDYKFSEALNDLALLHLTESCSERIKRGVSYPPEDTPAVLWGWGELKHATPRSDALCKASVLIRSKAVCAGQQFVEHTHRYVGDPTKMICAGGKKATSVAPEAGTCPGDSGGGLVIGNANDGWELVGISSWTDRRCNDGSGTPDVFVFVPAYADWIDQTIATYP